MKSSCEVFVAFSRNKFILCWRKAEINSINFYKFCSELRKSVFFHSRKQWLMMVLEIVSVVLFQESSETYVQNEDKMHSFNVEPGRVRRLL